MSWRDEDLEKQNNLTLALNRWLKGDPGAIRYVLDMVYIAHLWDDLVDRDKERTKEEIDHAFKVCLFHLVENPFYTRFIGELKPVMVNAYLNWQASNMIKDKAKEWFLRASIYNIIVHCAYLVGGMQWGEQMAPEIWEFYEEVIDHA